MIALESGSGDSKVDELVMVEDFEIGVGFVVSLRDVRVALLLGQN